MIFGIRDFDPNAELVFKKARTVLGVDYKIGDKVPQDFPLFLRLKLLRSNIIGLPISISNLKEAAKHEVKEIVEEVKEIVVEKAIDAVTDFISKKGRPKSK